MSSPAEKVALFVFKQVGDAMGAGGLTSVFDDHKGWSPVVPHDLHLAKLPPVAGDGTAACIQCTKRFPFAELDITGNAYLCRSCTLVNARYNAPQIDVDNLKVGRGRWWLVPLMLAGAGVVTLLIFLA